MPKCQGSGRDGAIDIKRNKTGGKNAKSAQRDSFQASAFFHRIIHLGEEVGEKAVSDKKPGHLNAGGRSI